MRSLFSVVSGVRYMSGMHASRRGSLAGCASKLLAHLSLSLSLFALAASR